MVDVENSRGNSDVGRGGEVLLPSQMGGGKGLGFRRRELILGSRVGGRSKGTADARLRVVVRLRDPQTLVKCGVVLFGKPRNTIQNQLSHSAML